MISARKLETYFDSEGITPELVLRQAAEIAELIRSGVRLGVGDTSNALYVNSSDSLEVLSRVALPAGRAAATVAGSGDFALTLVEAGWPFVDIIDLSLFALLYNELKLSAVVSLEYSEYCKLIGYPAIIAQRACPLVDADIYRGLRDRLSAHARTFFDFVLSPAGHALARVNDPGVPNGRYVRSRTCFPPATESRIPFLSEPRRYEELRLRLAQVRWSVRLGDISEVEMRHKTDYLYLTNVGFHTGRLPRILAQAFGRGIPRIGFVTRTRQSSPQVIDDRGIVYPSCLEVPAGRPCLNVFLDEGELPLLPGRHFRLGAVSACVVAVALGHDFPVYVEARADEQDLAVMASAGTTL
jgi:hypothetical protein